MKEVFKPFLGKLVMVYFDDILLFIKTKEEHLKHLRQIMMVLERENLYRNLQEVFLFHSQGGLLGLHCLGPRDPG